jgi:hypothetical protein
MRSLRTAALAVVGGILPALWGASGVAAEELNCSAYAGQAVAQNDQNLTFGCGYTGGRWSRDFGAHAQWCRNATMAQLAAEDGARMAALAECAKKPQQDQAACQAYAAEAVAQQGASQSRSCGLAGGAWSEDYAAHFDWCLKAEPAARAAEQGGRNQQLAGCVAAQQAAAQQANKDACAEYAAQAVHQQTENLERQCGFTGHGWNPDWFAHFHWCEASPAAIRASEAAGRQVALETRCMRLVCKKEDVVLAYPPFFETRTRCRNVPR